MATGTKERNKKLTEVPKKIENRFFWRNPFIPGSIEFSFRICVLINLCFSKYYPLPLYPEYLESYCYLCTKKVYWSNKLIRNYCQWPFTLQSVYTEYSKFFPIFPHLSFFTIKKKYFKWAVDAYNKSFQSEYFQAVDVHLINQSVLGQV